MNSIPVTAIPCLRVDSIAVGKQLYLVIVVFHLLHLSDLKTENSRLLEKDIGQNVCNN